MAHDVFISYANEDKTIADAVRTHLEERNIRCWIAPRDVTPGVYYAEAIIKAIKESRVIALVFSSSANKSEHVVREAEQAVRAGIPIIPFRIDSSKPAETLSYYIGPQHWLDVASPPVEKDIQRLGDAIELRLTTSAERMAGAEDASVTSHERLGGEIKPRARTSLVWRRKPQSRIFVGALAAAIVVLILIATGFAFLNLFSPTAPPQTTKPNTSSERPTVLGAGTLVLTASDYVSPNATLTRGDNITIQLFQSGTYQMKDRTGETGGAVHTFYA